MAEQRMMRRDTRGNSNFIAFVLIGIGVIWLLGQLNIFSSASFSVLARFWPLILVAIGLNLLVGRDNPQVGRLLGLGTLAVLLVLMFVGPSLGWAQSADVQERQVQAPLADADSAEIHLDLSVGNTTINTLTDSNQLITGDLHYLGDLRFDAHNEGSTVVVNLGTRGNVSGGSFFGFPFFNFDNDENNLRWDIRLSPEVPLDLDINGGVGTNTFDLSDLQVAELHLNGGVGETTLMLPATDHSYSVDVSGGVGKTTITVADGAAIAFDINGGVGEIILDLPDDAAVRIESNGGLGGVNVPSGYERTSGEGNNAVWETASYDDAGANERIDLNVDGGVGGFTIR